MGGPTGRPATSHQLVRKRTHVYTHVYGGPHWRLTVLNREQAAQLRDTPTKPLPDIAVEADDRRLFQRSDVTRVVPMWNWPRTSAPHPRPSGGNWPACDAAGTWPSAPM